MQISYDTPGFYTKKPVTILAIRFHPETHNSDEVAKFMINFGAIWEYSVANTCFEIKTLEGRMLINPGDWIIRGVKGEFYPCRDDIFRATYDSAKIGESHAP